jgi:site-specific recombinase XerD
VDGVTAEGVTVDAVLQYVGAEEGSLRYKALAANTWRGYKLGIRRWLAFARLRGLDALEPDAGSLSDCIEHYYEAGVGPTAIELMCTAVSTVFAWKTNVRLGQKDQVVSLVKAIYAENRIMPLQRVYFDPELLLALLEKEAHSAQGLQELLQRLAVLLVLCHAMRFTEMESIEKEDIVFGPADSSVQFFITLKTDQRRRTRVVIGEMAERPGVCVVRTLRRILNGERTEVPQVFAIKEGGRSKKMSASRISQLVKDVMVRAGLPDSITPYYCKHVGLTKAWEAGASEEQLRDVARWARNSEQFRKFYRLKDSADSVAKLIVGADGE